MKGTGGEWGSLWRQRLTLCEESKRKGFGMKLEVEERDFMHWFHRALPAQYKQSEEPCMGTSKILMIYARQCCPYVPGISDQVH